MAFSGAGRGLKTRLEALLIAEGYVILPEIPHRTLTETVAQAFRDANALIFIGACGIAVRGIAPFVSSKTTDPAVLVIDDNATWVISLLSGHIGGANDLSRTIAGLLCAQPIITTATDINKVFAVDVWARRQGLTIDSMQKAKTLSARLLAGETVPLKSEYPLPVPLPKGLIKTGRIGATFGVGISVFTNLPQEWLRLIPHSVYLGIGCRKGVSADAVGRTIAAALEQRQIDPRSIAGVGTIDIKQHEPGLTAFCRDNGWTLRRYSAEQLMRVPGSFTASEFVASVTGADNVCERSAVLASDGGRLLFGKYAEDGVTTAAAEKAPAISFEER